MIRKKKVAIIQSNYIPWKGYFDIIAAADEFVIYDEVQFTKNDWRNRNRIKTKNGLMWISIPVGQSIHRKICDVTISDSKWQRKHWNSIVASYGRAPFFDGVAAVLEPLYLGTQYQTLSHVNRAMIEIVCTYLGINTRIVDSRAYEMGVGKSERLVSICTQAGGAVYLSGPAARPYLDQELFARHGIDVAWVNYDNYLEYPQLWGEFTHYVSVLDLLFNCGQQAREYMKFQRPSSIADGIE